MFHLWKSLLWFYKQIVIVKIKIAIVQKIYIFT